MWKIVEGRRCVCVKQCHFLVVFHNINNYFDTTLHNNFQLICKNIILASFSSSTAYYFSWHVLFTLIKVIFLFLSSHASTSSLLLLILMLGFIEGSTCTYACSVIYSLLYFLIYLHGRTTDSLTACKLKLFHLNYVQSLGSFIMIYRSTASEQIHKESI